MQISVNFETFVRVDANKILASLIRETKKIIIIKKCTMCVCLFRIKNLEFFLWLNIFISDETAKKFYDTSFFVHHKKIIYLVNTL